MGPKPNEQRRTAEELAQLIYSIQISPIATVVTDCRLPDNPIVAANDAFVKLTGYTAGEILGRNCRFLAGPATEADHRARIRETIARNGQITTEITNYRKDGSRFLNALMIAPLLDADGEMAFFIGSQMEIRPSGLADGHRQREAQCLVERLTKRQKQVLALMASGCRNREIAESLGISEKTVKLHRALALDALEAQTSGDAIRIAVEARLAGLRYAD